MADLKFSALTPAGALNGTEEVPVVKTGSKKTTTQAIADLHTDAVSQVNGQAGVVALDQDDIGDGVTYKQYSATEKTKLAGIAAGAEVNVNADWNAVSGDALIQNKPTLGTAAAKNIPATGNASSTEVVYGTDTRLSDSRTPTAHTHAESEVTNLVTDLAGKVAGNTAITGATKTKITYDTKGLVTAGADATTADIADSLNKRYVTDAQLTVIGNTSGTNSGDNATNTQYSGLATSKQDTLVSGTNIKTINGSSVLGSGDLVVSGSGAAWGGITGTLSSQTDLNTALNGKASTAHASTHASGGSDPITTATPVAVKKAGVTTGTRRGVNFTEGSGITITTTDDAGNDDVDVTIAATAPTILTAKKASSQAITGAISDVTGMSVSLVANTTYRVYVNIPISTSTGTSPTLQLGFTGPTSPTVVNLRRIQMTSATAVANAVITSFTTFAAAASVANTHHTIEGIIVNGANAGTLQLRAAAAGTNPSITIAQGASIVAIAV